MRFKKGSRVEVLKKCEVPWGCWWCGTILSGNGRYYQVMYDRAIGGVAVERVLRKDMRPMPPPVGGLDNLVEGDIVEVFHCNSWKAATVTNPVDGFHFFVRLLGASCPEFSVHKTYVRLRQSWHDDQWFVVGMDHWDRGRNKLNNSPSNSGCVLPLPAMKRASLGANCNLVDDYTGFPNEGIHGSSFARGSLKRRSNICLSYINRNLEPACKVRTVEDICQRLVSHQLQQPEKIWRRVQTLIPVSVFTFRQA